MRLVIIAHSSHTKNKTKFTINWKKIFILVYAGMVCIYTQYPNTTFSEMLYADVCNVDFIRAIKFSVTISNTQYYKAMCRKRTTFQLY